MKKLGLALLLCLTLILLTGCACKHANTTLINVIPAACEQEGYSGDVYCNDCQETLERGSIVAALEHVPGELYNPIEPSCTTAGQTGSIFCTLCGDQIKMNEEIPATGHTLGVPYNASNPSCIFEGYTGDSQCSVCNEIIQGMVIPREDHKFVDNVCQICEWRVPGLYIDDNLQITWEQLKNAGHIEVKNGNKLSYVSDSLTGLLVVDEEVTIVEDLKGSSYYSSGLLNQLSDIYLPVTLEEIYNSAFERSSFSSVRFFGDRLKRIGNYAFEGCINLKTFSWPKTVTEMSNGVFEDCISLESIDIPDEVTVIDDRVFSGCLALKKIELPQSLVSIGSYAFSESGIEFLDIPEGVSLGEYASSIFRNCANLKSIDLSACIVNRNLWGNVTMSETFAGCTSLESVKLPEGITELTATFYGCSSLKELILPEGISVFNTYNGDNLAGLERVVWPTTLIDGSDLFKAAPNLKEIYYTGSEALWNITASKDLFTDVCYEFNYSYGNPFTNKDFKSVREIEAELLEQAALVEADALEEATVYEVKGFQKMKIAIALDENGNIKLIKVVEHNETPGFGADLVNNSSLFASMLGKNIATAQIDIKSGVTMTSKAINEALNAAASSSATSTPSQNESSEEMIAPVYEVKGFQPMKVAIAVDNAGRIVSVRVVEHNETPGFGANLINDTTIFDKLIGKEIATAQIDIKSGVTFTSKAINEALSQAASAASAGN